MASGQVSTKIQPEEYEAYEIAITRPRRRQTGYHCHEEN
jgi:hypothetical protein